jgi:hypothetical protein
MAVQVKSYRNKSYSSGDKDKFPKLISSAFSVSYLVKKNSVSALKVRRAQLFIALACHPEAKYWHHSRP